MTRELLIQQILAAFTISPTSSENMAGISQRKLAADLAAAIDSYVEAKIGERMQILIAGGILAPTPAGPAPLIPGPNIATMTKIA